MVEVESLEAFPASCRECESVNESVREMCYPTFSPNMARRVKLRKTKLLIARLMRAIAVTGRCNKGKNGFTNSEYKMPNEIVMK